MTPIEQQALALINEVLIERGKVTVESDCISREQQDYDEILCRAIERHEAFKQDVSEAIVGEGYCAKDKYTPLARFIIPAPVDPLVEVLDKALGLAEPEYAVELRAALADRGLKIVEADA